MQYSNLERKLAVFYLSFPKQSKSSRKKVIFIHRWFEKNGRSFDRLIVIDLNNYDLDILANHEGKRYLYMMELSDE